MNKFSIKYSVVLTVYNKENFIKETIESVLNQTFRNFELIIVNDGSTDRSLDIAQSFHDDRIKLIHQENKGVSAARNKGISSSTFDYIAFIDGDDLWMTDFLETITAAIVNNRDQAVFATAIAHKYPSKTVAASYPFTLDGNTEILDFFRFSLKQSLLTSSSVVIKKFVFNKIGDFNESFQTSEDVDMWIRVGMHFPIVFIKELKVLYVYNNESLSNTDFDISKKNKYDSYIEEEKLNPEMKKYVDKNRYALALMSKIHDDRISYQFYLQHLDKKNLSLRQQLLLLSPKWFIDLLLWLKSFKGEKLYYKSLSRRNSS